MITEHSISATIRWNYLEVDIVFFCLPCTEINVSIAVYFYSHIFSGNLVIFRSFHIPKERIWCPNHFCGITSHVKRRCEIMRKSWIRPPLAKENIHCIFLKKGKKRKVVIYVVIRVIDREFKETTPVIPTLVHVVQYRRCIWTYGFEIKIQLNKLLLFTLYLLFWVEHGRKMHAACAARLFFPFSQWNYCLVALAHQSRRCLATSFPRSSFFILGCGWSRAYAKNEIRKEGGSSS